MSDRGVCKGSHMGVGNDADLTYICLVNDEGKLELGDVGRCRWCNTWLVMVDEGYWPEGIKMRLPGHYEGAPS